MRNTDMKLLHLSLKEEYFRAIESGEKTEEFRLFNRYWRKRLTDLEDGSPNHFDGIVLTLGYPKADDLSKRIERPWRGFEIKRITHPLFGKLPVRVFAIKVN